LVDGLIGLRQKWHGLGGASAGTTAPLNDRGGRKSQHHLGASGGASAGAAAVAGAVAGLVRFLECNPVT